MLRADCIEWGWPGSGRPLFSKISLHVTPGECHCLTGSSGSGKSTLLLSLAGLLPTPLAAGGISVPSSSPESAGVSVILQNPAVQFLADTAQDEVLFALRQLPLPEGEAERRADQALDLCGLTDRRNVAVSDLSMGQQYRLLLAAMLALSPKALILDEPCAQLDPDGLNLLREIISRRRADGLATLYTAHHEQGLAPVTDRWWRLEDGTLAPAPPRSAPERRFPNTAGHAPEESGVSSCEQREAARAGNGVCVCEPQPPVPVLTAEALSILPAREQSALTGPPKIRPTRQARQTRRARRTEEHPYRHRSGLLSRLFHPGNGPRQSPAEPAEEVFRTDGASVPHASAPLWKDVSLNLFPGETVYIHGPNGCGKSTLLRCLAGLEKPASGRVSVLGKAPGSAASGDLAYVPQDPSRCLFATTLTEEVGFGLRRTPTAQPSASSRPAWKTAERIAKQTAEWTGIFGLSSLAGHAPRLLSYGQQQLAAVAALTVTRPRVLLLDDPLAGLDAEAAARMLTALDSLAGKGTAILVAGHDPAVAKWARREYRFEGGYLLAGPSAEMPTTRNPRRREQECGHAAGYPAGVSDNSPADAPINATAKTFTDTPANNPAVAFAVAPVNDLAKPPTETEQNISDSTGSDRHKACPTATNPEGRR